MKKFKMRLRFRRIDQIRGVALMLMIIFHTAFDLNFLNIYSINVWEGVWYWMAKTVQWTFILTTGITLTIAHQRGKSRLKHILKLGACAMMITVVTWLLFKEKAVVFGILHFYTVALLLAHPFLKLKTGNVPLGVALFLLSGTLIQALPAQPWLFFLGKSTGVAVQALDYFPLLPWFSVFLIGVGMGNLFRELKQPTAKGALLKLGQILIPFEKMGQHSLVIYLVHQPLIYGILKVMFS